MVKKIVKENWVYLLIILIIIVCFNIIYRTDLNIIINKFDEDFFRSISDFRSGFFVSLLKVVTEFGDIYIPITILLLLLLFKKNKYVFSLQAASYLFAGIITYISKLSVGRARPIEALINIPSSYSFPSGHTLTSFVFYIILTYLLTYNCKKEIRNSSIILTSLFTLLIAFSRPYLGVHFLSDVIGGIILAIPIIFMIINIINKNFSKKLSGK
jgi:undecaprenyl-diphosphatase